MSARSAQLLAATLAFLLIVLVGATIFVLLSRPASPRATATPTIRPTGLVSPTASGSAVPSPTPTLAPGETATPTLEPTPTLIPTASPEPTPSEPPTPSPSPSPSPVPTPTLNPTAPQRELQLINVGLDSRGAEGSIQRFVSFVVDGNSRISARLSNVSAGQVRLCLWRQDVDSQRECRTTRNGALERSVFDAGQTTWNVSMIGTVEQTSPFATLTLSFNTFAPSVTLDSFRYLGTSFNEYNGFAVELPTAAAGDMRVQASFDDGQGGPYPYRLLVTRSSTGEVISDQPGGPAQNVDLSVPLTGPDAFRVELRNTDALAAGGTLAVFVHATITWP